MATEEFSKKLRLNNNNKALLNVINKIIEEYRMQGYRLTLRQLYYQLVSRDIIANAKKEYAKLSTLLTKGRMAGVVDWDAIEDRGRRPYIPYSVRNVEHAVQDTINQYRLNRQKGQKIYIELWVEKDALSGVLKRITEKYHIKLIVNKGYSSTSAMYGAYERVKDKILDKKKVVILYLGDHDPSGLDMIRDIRDRTKNFIGNSEDVQEMWDDKRYVIDGDELVRLEQELREDYYWENEDYFSYEVEDDEGILQKDMDFPKCYAHYIFDNNIEVRPIGLTMEQIKEFNPPANPAKITDPRAKWYVKKFGAVSWEVDALNPDTLHKLVRENVEGMIDMDLFNEQLAQEEVDKEKLRGFTFSGDEE